MSSATPSSGRPDSEQHGIPHGQALATGSSTATAVGVTIDNSGTSWPVSAYRSLVVAVNVTGGSDVTVTPLWSFLNSAADVANSAEQVAPAGQASRLIFQNQGDTLEGVTFTAAADSDFNYYVAGANLDPLPASAPATIEVEYPTLYNIPILLPAVGEDSTNWALNTADAASFGAAYRGVTNVNVSGAYFTTLLRLGPHGALYEISSYYNEFNQAGKLRFQLASVVEDWPGAGLADPAGLVQASALDGAVYVSFPAVETKDMSGAALIRNVRNAKNPEFRLTGQPGDPLTAITATVAPDSAFFPWNANGGPGLYRLKAIVDAAGSVGGKFGAQLVALVVRRVDYAGF